jgi:type II secretory pathway pseudopilin PulG
MKSRSRKDQGAKEPPTTDFSSRFTFHVSRFTFHASRVADSQSPIANRQDSVLAFTMIEIAICLAVIGFALLAIVGVLPLGMNVQRENREETVINQDASVFINAIRNGELGLDDLTNYVVAVTNSWAVYSNKRPVFHTNGYTRTNSTSDSVVLPNYLPLTSGFGIVGLLSTPKYVQKSDGANISTFSNYVVAYVRSLSGDASEKFPQTNVEVQAFSYRMISEVVPYADFDRNWTNYLDPAISGNASEFTARSNYWMVAKTLQTNLYDLRLIFRYPLLANGNAGNGRLVFRTSASGHLNETTAPGFSSFARNPPYLLYFFQSGNYVKAQ